jgi:Zn-dependent protease with chaperone function
MTTQLSWEFWGALAARLALAATAMVALAALAHLALSAAAWRRALWRGVLLGLSIIFLAELGGVGAWVASRRVQAPLPTRDDGGASPAAKPVSAALQPVALSASQPMVPTAHGAARASAWPQPGWWPAILWAAGVVPLLLRAGLSRLKFQIQMRRGRVLPQSECPAKLLSLAQRMNLSRPVRLVRLPGLASPVAFGLWRPVLGIPTGFERHFTPAEQAAILAHELAHVKAGDLLWQFIGGLALGIWWWHPLAWRAHRQWLEATEMAADEGSAIIEDGPEALAAGLLVLGRQLNSATLGTGMRAGGGFKSLLGRRVDRLLRLKRPAAVRPVWLRVFMAANLVGLGCAAWGAVSLGAYPLHAGEYLGHVNWRLAWRQSLAGRMLATASPVAPLNRAPRNPENLLAENVTVTNSPQPNSTVSHAVLDHIVVTNAAVLTNAALGKTVTDQATFLTNAVIEPAVLTKAATPHGPSIIGSATNESVEISIQATVIEIATTIEEATHQALSLLGSRTNPASAFTITALDAADLVERLELRPGVDIMHAPSVKTISGRSAHVESTVTRQVLVPLNGQWHTNTPTNWISAFETVIAPPAGGTNTLTMNYSTGVALDYRAEKGPRDTIKLAVDYQMNAFYGYGTPESLKHWRLNLASNQTTVPLPRFQMAQMSSQLILRPGETLVCGPMVYDCERKTRDKVPVLGDIPLIGRLFRSESISTERKTSYLLITPKFAGANNP